MVSGGKKVRGKHRLDKFYHLAKEQGYRSRAAFKLIQLNKKHGFLNDARAVLDLCAAPGGWLQVCAKHMPVASRIIGVDLDAVKPIRGVKTLVDDITTQSCRDRLKRESEGSLFDVVLHDGAPNVGGRFAAEMYTQSALVLDSCKLACEFLRPDGTFVTKVFRSRDYNALLYAFRQLFRRVDAVKPQASRNTSAEIFVVCSGYKAPAKIDPRLLDHRVLFQDMEEAKKPMGPDALLKSIGKKMRHRTGYDENVNFHRSASAVAFVLAKDPMPMLANFSEIVLDGPDSLRLETAEGEEDEEVKERCLDVAEMARLVLEHPATNAEVKALLKDLQVLGRSEFKQLLRWRLKLKKELENAEKAARKAAAAEGGDASGMHVDTSGSEEEGAGDDQEPLDPEERLLKEMEALKAKIDHDRRKTRKKRRELKKKAKVRLATMAQSAGLGEQLTAEDDALFSLKTLKNKAALAKAGDAEAMDEDEVARTLEAADSDDELVGPDTDSDADSDEDARRYEAMVEEYLDGQYRAYLDRRQAKSANVAEKHKRKRLRDDHDETGVDADGLEGLPSARAGESASESEDSEEGGGLLVDLDETQAGRRKTGVALTEQWFSQDVFADEDLLDDYPERPPALAKPSAKRGRAAAESDEVDSDDAGDGDDDEEFAADELDDFDIDALGSDDAEASDDDDDDDDSDSDQHVGIGVRAVKPAAAAVQPSSRKRPRGSIDDDDDESSDEGMDVSDQGVDAAPGDKEADEDDVIRGLKAPGARKAVLRDKARAEKAKMEVVPQQTYNSDGASTDTEDEFAAMDTHAQAEIRAMARKWLKSRKNQLSILDAAYNRYTFDDEGLPRWFKEDEARHARPMAPATRDEIEAEKELLRAIDARPLKKVAEAKARKHRKVAKKLEEARRKSESIVDNEDMSVRSKAKEIGKLYSRARAAGNDKRSARRKQSNMSRSQKEKAKRKGPPLDRRMMADKRKGRAGAASKGKRGRK